MHAIAAEACAFSKSELQQQVTTHALYNTTPPPPCLARPPLNLKHPFCLPGPQRRQLRVEDKKNELKFDPKGLLKQIASIYVNLSRRDSQGILAQAIAADKRSYYEEMFAEAIQV